MEHGLLALMGLGSEKEDVEEQLGLAQLAAESVSISVLVDA